MITFNELNLNAKIIQAIEELGFEQATEIQEQAIPYLLESDNDLIALAQTGTGKTAAFGIPILEQIDTSIKDVQTIVLCPTRELCMQLAKDLVSFSKYMKGLQILAVYGGTPISGQIKDLKKGPQIVVGTPGRTLDLINRKKLNLSNIRFVVFDEADEMLSMGFKDDMDAILEVTPDEKQVLLFSATMPKEIAKMASRYMEDPFEISIGHKNTGSSNVEHQYYDVPGRRKYEVLKRLADLNPSIYGIIFCRTRAETKDIAEKLGRDGYSADAIHGDLSQAQRDIVMNRFRNRNIQLLVATDVAARGIDVDDLTHVINYNLPDEIATYVHRSGRTGRANKFGVSIVLLSGRDRSKLGLLERKIGRQIQKMKVPSGKDVCRVQLLQLMDKVRDVEVSEDIEEYLEVINEKFEGFSREELIQKFISLEFNRFLSYYKDADDLNAKSKKDRYKDRMDDKRNRRKDRRERRDRGRFEEARGRYDRFYINLGEKHDVNPGKILELINRQTKGHSVDVGQIEILSGFSFFEVPSDFTPIILQSFKKAKYNGFAVVVQPSNPKPEKAKMKRKKKRSFKEDDRKKSKRKKKKG